MVLILATMRLTSIGYGGCDDDDDDKHNEGIDAAAVIAKLSFPQL